MRQQETQHLEEDTCHEVAPAPHSPSLDCCIMQRRWGTGRLEHAQDNPAGELPGYLTVKERFTGA